MKKPFKTYFGGKEANGVYQTIINQIRPCDVFYEPFGGNLTISRKIAPCLKLVNDIDKNTFEKYIDFNEKQFQIFNLDYREFLKTTLEYYKGFQRVIYFDPPYPLESRKSNRKVYKHEFSAVDHIIFLEYVNKIKNDNIEILISTYPNEVYKKELSDWYMIEFEGMDRQGKTTECLFMNYNPAEITKLHDARYFGKDNLERQFNKRTTKNAVEKFKKMNPILRNEILNQISCIQN